MAREYMCDYGNCEETNVSVTVTYAGKRNRYCTLEHAGLHMLVQFVRCSGPIQQRIATCNIVIDELRDALFPLK